MLFRLCFILQHWSRLSIIKRDINRKLRRRFWGHRIAVGMNAESNSANTTQCREWPVVRSLTPAGLQLILEVTHKAYLESAFVWYCD